MNFDEIRWCWFFGNPWMFFVGIFLNPWLLLVFHADGQQTNLQVLCLLQLHKHKTMKQNYEIGWNIVFLPARCPNKKYTKHGQILDIIKWRADTIRCLNVPSQRHSKNTSLWHWGFAFCLRPFEDGRSDFRNINHEHQFWMFSLHDFWHIFQTHLFWYLAYTLVILDWQENIGITFFTDLHRPNKSWD